MLKLLRKSQQLCEQVLDNCRSIECSSCKHHGESSCPGVKAMMLSEELKGVLGEHLFKGDKITFEDIKSEYIVSHKDGSFFIVDISKGDVVASFEDYLTPTTLFHSVEEHIAPIKTINGARVSKGEMEDLDPNDYIYDLTPGDESEESYLNINGLAIDCPSNIFDVNVLDNSECNCGCEDCYNCWMNNWDITEKYIKQKREEK